MKRLVVATVLLTLGIVPSASAEAVVGRWCDVEGSFAQQLTIIRLEDQTLVLESRFQGGQVSRQPLNLHGSTYWLRGSDHGDHFRVIPQTGALQLSDIDGPIRVAQPIRTSGRCIG